MDKNPYDFNSMLHTFGFGFGLMLKALVLLWNNLYQKILLVSTKCHIAACSTHSFAIPLCIPVT